jgi:integrase
VTPRKATLRIAHQATCPNASKTAIESKTGCKCQPSFYVMWRDPSGATRKSPRVRDRREADKMLRAKQVEIDQGRAGNLAQKNLAFPEWVDEYERILEMRPGIKGETRRTYHKTLVIAKDAIGHVRVRDLGNAELRRFHAKIAHTAEATQIKHLTQLGACLTAAIDEGYADTNPVGSFRRGLRLRAQKGTPPFTDGEAARLLAALVEAEVDGVYVAIVRAALELGARVGELIALDWSNVDLTGGTVKIRHTYNTVDGLTTPKDRDERDIYLTPGAEQVFADWLGTAGVEASGLVFRAPRSKGFVDVHYLRKLVLAAMTTAGIEKIDAQSGRPRKPLHSLRATYARRMLEQGKHPQWVEAQLGHADLELTMQVYGAWSAEAMRAEAAREAVVR